MERLVAMYRITSSVGAVVALVVANLVPLVGVLFFDWDLRTILVLYWLENGVIGVFNVLKIAVAAGPGGLPVARPLIAGFFLVHYGLFWFVHGIFVWTLPLFSSVMTGGDLTLTGSGGPTFQTMALAVVVLTISHGIAYRLDFIGHGEYLRTTPQVQASAPYPRLFVLHLTIIFGALVSVFLGTPLGALIVLVILKIGLDLSLHLRERRRFAPAAASGTGVPPGAPD